MKGVSEELHLKPCPFCGSDDLDVYAGRYYNEYQIYCEECGGRVGFYKSLPEAIEHWNKRVDEEANLRLLGAAPRMYKLLKVWTQICSDPTLIDALAKTDELLARIDEKEEITTHEGTN